MDAETKNKLKPILLRSNLNQFVSEDELAFARQCWRKWPKEYSALQTEEVHPQAVKRIVSTQQSRHFQSPTPPTPRHSRTQRTRTRRGI